MGWFTKKKQDEPVQETVVNSNDASIVRRNFAAGISGTYEGADTLHNIYSDFGYPQTLSFSDFWNIYRRLGIAKNVVELPIQTTWMDEPIVTSEDDQFTRELEKLVKQTRLWTRLRALDLRQRIGRYAGLFVRVRDNLSPEQPIGGLNGIGSVIQLIPIAEGQLTVLSTDSDEMSDTYGQPTMYQFNSSGVGNRDEKTAVSFSIHPSRLIMTAEGADDGSIYGVPALEAPFNSLMDLRKIIGAGGEGFYKNAAQSVLFKLMDSSSALQNKELLQKFNDQYDDFIRNRHRRGLWTPGLEPSVLDSNLRDPKEFFMAALNDVAASCAIPATILIGQQTGRLASNEDSRSYLSGINSRRETYVSNDIIMATIDWMMKNRVLPMAEYEVEWNDLLALSDKEKLDAALNMVKINKEQFSSGEEIPFTSREIRAHAGYDIEPEDDMLDPELDEETDGGIQQDRPDETEDES